MSKLADAVKAKLAADKVSPTAAARAVGLSLPSFRGMLKGKSSPNARSLKKYAKLLGVSEDEVKALVGAAEAKPAKGRKGKPGRKAKAKAKGKPGRKPGRKAKGKPGRKPGRKPAGKAGIGPVIALLEQAEAIMTDDLAVAVHGMGKAQRATLAAIIASLA